MFKLTRFLYNEEEVKLSLIASILIKKNIMECYYWFSELYYSKNNAYDMFILWEIYFDYYSLINPKLEYYMIKKIKESKETNDISPLLYIIKNMHILKHDPNVFLLRQISNIDDLYPCHIYKIKHTNCINTDVLIHSLLISIKKKYWIDICYYLKKIVSDKDSYSEPRTKHTSTIDSYTIYISIIDYFSLEHKEQLIYTWKSRIESNDFHYILKFICNIVLNINTNPKYLNINNRSVYVSPSSEDIHEIKSIEQESIPLTSKGNKQIYKTLSYKRQFEINKHIGSFDLIRFNVSNYKQENYNWEYYASFTQVWKERIDLYKGSVNHEKKCIEFKDDEHLELFYEDYGYELDEQSKEVQDLSLLTLEQKMYIDWFDYIWSELNEKLNTESNYISEFIGSDFKDIVDTFRLK
jgi:hypothetical protein